MNQLDPPNTTLNNSKSQHSSGMQKNVDTQPDSGQHPDDSTPDIRLLEAATSISVVQSHKDAINGMGLNLY